MDPLRILAETRGFFTRAEARELGYDDRAMAAIMRSDIWLRIRRGYYTFPDLWPARDAVAQHRVRAAAVFHALGDVVALSHVSAALEHGLQTWGVPLDRVHVTRLDGGAGRLEGDVVHHVGVGLDGEVVERGGKLVTSPTRSALEAGTLGTPESALVHLDSLLHLELDTHEGLFARFEMMARWPHTRHLHIPVRMADGGSASAGESRGRWLFRIGGLPAPATQFEVRALDGRLIGTCDWGWPQHGLLGEFDGRTKYGRLLKPGMSAGEVVFAEKHREDLIREASGCAMVRIIWDDLSRPELTAARVRRLLRQSA
ncbi:MAG: type IV toxin-antitoxin system AbiEi family antitoxin domain-containing protein [Nocardioides sp.]|uniref:type IV toxin-antitoxin system AbiEi family antitoxin domain-containing protein n=1 Tax=Nocardioides sp. TaxID=35761 RepID=UPI0039E684CE